MATDTKRKPTPRKYTQLKRQVGKKGVQKGVETLAQKRVMRHQKMTHSEAQAYIRARTAEGRSVGGYNPSDKQRKAAKPQSGSDASDAARKAGLLKRKAEQEGNITNKPQGKGAKGNHKPNPVGPRNESQPQGSRIAPEDVGARAGHTVGDINISVHVPPPAPPSTGAQARPGSRPGSLAGNSAMPPSRDVSQQRRAAAEKGSAAKGRGSHGAYTPSKPVNKSVPVPSGNANVGGNLQPGPIRRGTTGPLPGPVAHTVYTRPGVGKGKAKPISGGGGRAKVR